MNLYDITEKLIWFYVALPGWLLIVAGLIGSLLVATDARSWRRASLLALLQLTPIVYVLLDELTSRLELDRGLPRLPGIGDDLLLLFIVAIGPLALIAHAWRRIARPVR